MIFLPVLDVMGGRVVRAVGGRRLEYKPLVSRLTASTDPVTVAAAIRERFRWTEFYVADLDAITGRQPPATNIYARLHGAGITTWVDAGVRTGADAAEIQRAGVAQVVVGSETLGGLAAWRDVVRAVSEEHVTFSLDLRAGRVLNPETWTTDDPTTVADCVVAESAQRVIILDLERVGENQGVGTEELFRVLAIRHPEVTWIAGGGVRNRRDILRLLNRGVSGVLLASALHDARITPADLHGL
jgi:phosphoribosylformimino-5-aminoimidazole carboxamide ribotide isomerase